MALSISAILAIATDSSGIYYQVSGATPVDNIFVFTDGVNKFQIVQNKGRYLARLGGILPGSNKTTELQAIFNHSEVTEVILDYGDITINGSLTIPAGKTLTFQGNGALTGSGTITGGIINAGMEQNIFKGTLTMNYAAVANSASRNSVKWFGALGNNAADDYAACQRCINVIVHSNTLTTVYFPVGRYRISKGLLVLKDSNGDFVSEFAVGKNIEGATTTYGDSSSDGESKIIITNVNSFALGIHRGKGIRVTNINIEGQNTALLSKTYYQIIEDPATDFNNGCRANTFSPHALFIVDPFVNGTVVAGDRYPDFLSYYVSGAAGGSTDVVFENCRARYGVVGFCFSPHGSPQNGDNLWVKDSWSDYCRSAFAIGQSQNRSVHLVNVKCWGQCKTVLDEINFSDGTADGFDVDGIQLAGVNRFLVEHGNWAGTKGTSIKHMHSEGLGSLGGYLANNGSIGGILTITNSWIHLSPAVGGLNNHFKAQVYRGTVLTIKDSFFGYYNGATYHPMVVQGSAHFDRVNFEHIPIVNASSTRCVAPLFIDCFGAGSVTSWGHNVHQSGGSSAELGNSRYFSMAGSTWQPRRSGPNKFNSYIRTCLPQRRSSIDNQDSLVTFITQTGTVAASNINTGAQTADLAYTPNGEAVLKLLVGDFLFINYTNEYGDALQYKVLGKVNNINVGTGVVQLSTTMADIAATNYTNILCFRQPQFFPAIIVGNIVSGSATVTGTVLDGFATQISTLATVNSPFFPDGTHVVSFNSGTGDLVMSNPATATVSQQEIIAQDWIATEKGIPQPASGNAVGYKRGDIIYNDNFSTYPDVTYWVCTKSGVSSTAMLPEFRAYYRTNVPTFANDAAADTMTEIFYYNTVTNKHKIKNGSTWYTLPETNLASGDQTLAGTRAITLGAFDLTIDATGAGDFKVNFGSDATGDMIVRDATGDLSRLGVGTSTQKLGSSGTLPVWKDVYKTAVLASVDGSIAIATDTLVTTVAINPASPLAAFSIGTTNGGAELLPAIPTPSGWQTYNISSYYSASGNIWFNGITSSTQIRVYMET